MNNLFSRLLAIFICCVSLTGCIGSSVAAAIPTVVAAVTDASAVLNLVQSAVNVWFARNPDDTEQAKINELIQRSWAGIRAANLALQGAENLSQEDYDRAMSDFRNAYGELQVLLQKKGILSGSRGTLLSMDGGEKESVEIAPPMALSLKVD